MILVTFNENYADEFDVCGFKIYDSVEEFNKEIVQPAKEYFEKCDKLNCSEKRYQAIRNKHERSMEFKRTILGDSYDEDYDFEMDLKIKNGLNHMMAGLENSFGTNEDFRWYSFKTFMECFEVKEIHDSIGETFPKREFGFFPVIADWMFEELDNFSWLEE